MRRSKADVNQFQVIGSSCPCLEVLDVAHSRQVTDNGVRDLLVSVELKDKGQNEANQGSRDQQQKSPQRWNKFKMLAKFVPWMRNDNSGLCSRLFVLPRQT
jgi:hypothetical protein